jgi:hypothetical protein
MVVVVLGLLLGTVMVTTVGGAFVARGRVQGAADSAALAAVARMRDDYPRVLAAPVLPNGAANPVHMPLTVFRARARSRARQIAVRAGIARSRVRVDLSPTAMPTAVTVRVTHRQSLVRTAVARPHASVGLRAVAGAELEFDLNGSWAATPGSSGGGGYSGPLAYRQGRPMRPDVAAAFDRMAAAARAAGHTLVINSALRSDAEQQRLWDRHPDPRWVAPPGTSLHRYGTELDLGPPPAYGWLASNARRFGFIKRYAWEPWHYGFGSNPRDVPAQYEKGSWEPPDGRHDRGRSGLPPFVPARFAPMILRAADRWNVSGELLAAQLRAESDFNPNARSNAGAMGIAQFMPGTARAYGLGNPFDPAAAIDAQAQLMSDLIKRFGKVELALAAYNAGEGAVQRYGGIPPYSETRAYVARIVGMLRGSLADLQTPGMGLTASVAGVRLVR